MEVTEIAAGNTANITLYPSWTGDLHTARFVDQNGNVIYEENFEQGATSLLAVPAVPEIPFCTGAWEDYSSKLKNATADIVIYPVYTVSSSQLTATGKDTNGDGIIDYYEIGSVNLTPDETTGGITIPGYINGIPVKVVTGLSDNLKGDVRNIEIQEGVEQLTDKSFAGTPNMTQVWLPSSLKLIGTNTFSIQGQDKKENLTIYYAGTQAEWDKVVKETGWDKGLRDGSKIVCTDKTGEFHNNGTIIWSAN